MTTNKLHQELLAIVKDFFYFSETDDKKLCEGTANALVKFATQNNKDAFFNLVMILRLSSPANSYWFDGYNAIHHHLRENKRTQDLIADTDQNPPSLKD